MEISDEKLELFAGMEPIDAVDKTVKSMASDLLSTRADLAAAREELAKYRWIPVGERLPESEGLYEVIREQRINEPEIDVLPFTLFKYERVEAKHFFENEYIQNYGAEAYQINDVTHWRYPVLLPPKDGEG